MAITLPQGFKVTSQEPIDSRIVLTKAEMLSYAKISMPSNYICVCKDDGKLYIYNKSVTPSETTGYFQPYEEVIDLPKAISDQMESESGKAAMEEAVAKTIPGAIADAMNTPGEAQKIVDAMFDSDHFEVTLDNKIDLAISVIECIDGN